MKSHLKCMRLIANFMKQIWHTKTNGLVLNAGSPVVKLIDYCRVYIEAVHPHTDNDSIFIQNHLNKNLMATPERFNRDEKCGSKHY